MPNLTLRVGVGAIVLKDEQLLLGIRNVYDNMGQWELLGGLIEPKETLEVAVKRQVMEEAGIKIEPNVIVAHYDRYFNNSTVRNIGICFRCNYLSGEPRQTEFGRVSDFQWVSLENALNLDITQYTRLQLEQYQQWLKNFGLQ